MLFDLFANIYFGDLQLWRSEADGQIALYVFDVLWLEGYDVMNLPLEERHQLLRSIIPPDNGIIEMGLYNDPFQKMYALGDEMHRAIRLVVDAGMHAKGW